MLASVALLAGELAVFFLLCLGAVAIHEMGHVVAGIACGFRIVGVRVGPVRWDRNEGTKFKLGHLSRAEGVVLVQLREFPSKFAAGRIALFFLGGSLANFALVASIIILRNTLAGNLLALLSVVSLFVGLINLIPFKTKRGLTDGAKLFGMVFSNEKRRTMIERLSVLPRIEEVTRLCRNGEYCEAYPKLEMLISFFQSIAPAPEDPGYPHKLIRLKEQIAVRLNHHPSAPEISTARISESI